MNERLIFRERLTEILKETKTSENKLTQKQIAKLCNIDPSCITQYKKGDCEPTLDTLFKLCRVLDCSADYILGLTDEY